jgi:hypothetical protein
MPANLTPQDHLARARELENQAANFRAIWQEIQDYVTPWRDPIISRIASGQKETDLVFDSTAMHALITSASAMGGLTTPQGMKWFSYRLPDKSLNELVEVGRWSEDTTQRAMNALNNSNFATEDQIVRTDLLAFGTAALYMDVRPPSAKLKFPGFTFKTLAPGSYVCAENDEGIVDTVYRKFTLPAQAVWRRWGEQSGPLVGKLMQDKKWDQQVQLVQAIAPRMQDVDMRNDLRVTPSKRPWTNLIMITGTNPTATAGQSAGSPGFGPSSAGLGPDNNEVHVISEGGFFDMPVLVPRWYRMSGETYGRSPVMNAMPDIRTLNKAVELRLKAWQLQVAPPIVTADRGVIGDVRLNPYGRTYVRNGFPRDAVFPLQLGGDFNVANFSEQQLQAQIQRALFIDQIQSASSSGLTPKSATEVSINFEMMMRILGPIATTLQTEYLGPLVTGVFRTLQRHGVLAELPLPLDDLDELNVIYEGPLARAQSIQEIDATSRWLQITLPLAELHPEIMTWVDFSELGKTLADAVSLPREVMRSREEVEEMANAQAQQQAAAQGQQDLLGSAEVINKVTPALVGLNGRTGGAT